MNQRTFFSATLKPFSSLLLIIHSYIIIISLQSPITLSSLDPKYEACEPKTCGNDQNISYPFYIKGKQEPFCGNPDFELTCDNNGFPVITTTISSLPYTVHQIFYNNQSFRVSIQAFSQPNTTQCIPRIINLAPNTPKVSVTPNQKGVLLFFGCDLSSLPEGMKDSRVGCSAENVTRSILALYEEDPNVRLASKNCNGGMVNTTVENENGGIQESLQRGFMVNWTAGNCVECTNSGGRCGFDYDIDVYAFRCYCPQGDRADYCHPQPKANWLNKANKLGLALGIAVLLIIIYCIRRRIWKEKSKAQKDFEAFLKNHGPLAIRRYSYLEVKKMTNSFAEKLGQGGYGGVFKGKLHDERLVAVKMLNRSKGDGEEFINEVTSISRTSHVNIVTLLGFCFEGSKRALVYEYICNGSLEKFIYGTIPMAVDNQLNCEQLYQIAVGVARGLEYLHRGCNTRIYHFDIKPHNILLDENFCPKISDFGLAKICPQDESMVSMLVARGTPGYIAPEVFSRNFGMVSHKSDVYSFGMMVLEMVGGRENINVEVDCSSEFYFPHWIYKRLQLNEELEFRNITSESDRERMRKLVIISLWCIQTDPLDRPTMHTVVDMLEGRVETLQMPPKPFLSSPSRSELQSLIS
ncbi:hypothetical protein RIF29_16393 [Crotalaria pallida]|uniref:non-specific serine/threonine protein kinase n=1 Tax=Crotalaria pallida TaxID=3830 RepID=A0AAN9FFA4_CROPI